MPIRSAERPLGRRTPRSWSPWSMTPRSPRRSGLAACTYGVYARSWNEPGLFARGDMKTISEKRVTIVTKILGNMRVLRPQSLKSLLVPVSPNALYWSTASFLPSPVFMTSHLAG